MPRSPLRIASVLRSLGSRWGACLAFAFALLFSLTSANRAEAQSRPEVAEAMRKATTYYRKLAVRGGYVYFYTEDLERRWGEGLATSTQIWIQPPGTPTVGMALLRAHEATGDKFYLDAANEAAEAVAYGQLRSGGWTNSVDFDPRSKRAASYRNGRGRGKNNSSLDDGQTQSALRFLIQADKANRFENPVIRESAKTGLEALLKAQFRNGAFPQVWTGPVKQFDAAPTASFPPYDWRTEGRIKNYWDMYTLNDNVCGYVLETLLEAHRTYNDERCLRAIERLGDFLIQAQMPEPQPGWAQQYNYEMRPIWARKFEPPGVAGDETQEAIDTLLRIHETTGDAKYLRPIPAALAWLKRSKLADGRLARYYELKSNRPLYMQRQGDTYTLTYDDRRLPKHYGWKIDARIDALASKYERRIAKQPSPPTPAPSAAEVRTVIEQLDDQGRWLTRYQSGRLVGQPKFAPGDRYLSSEVFSRNLTLLSDHLER